MAAAIAAGAYILGSQEGIKKQETACTLEAKICPDGSSVGRVGPNCEFALCPTPQAPTPIAETKHGWKVYTSEKYGFEISYPDTYQALDDQQNLYGWPNGVVLFYNGGQAYDIAIQAWDSEADYQKAYPTSNFDLAVHEVRGKFITILNSTQEPQNPEIISTFKVTN